MDGDLGQAGNGLRVEPAVLADDAEPSRPFGDEHSAVRQEGEAPRVLETLDYFHDAKSMFLGRDGLRGGRQRSEREGRAAEDGPLRKPRVHAVFHKKQQPGLSNVLVGNAKASEAVQTTTVPGLWVLPAGVHPPNPAELLGSRRFKDFMASLAEHFDWVVVDTPPVMAVTDSSVVAHLATGVLFVVGAEMTSRHAGQRALDQLENAKARLVGAVLNRVDLKHNAYYYSQYYRREYSDYYQKEPLP